MAGLFVRPAIFVLADFADFADFLSVIFRRKDFFVIKLMIQIISVNLFQ